MTRSHYPDLDGGPEIGFKCTPGPVPQLIKIVIVTLRPHSNPTLPNLNPKFCEPHPNHWDPLDRLAASEAHNGGNNEGRSGEKPRGDTNATATTSSILVPVPIHTFVITHVGRIRK